MARDPLETRAGHERLAWLMGILALVGSLGLVAVGLLRGDLPPLGVRLALALATGGAAWILFLRYAPPARLAAWEGRIQRLRRQPGRRAVWCLALAYTAVMGVYVVVRHLRFNSGGFDLAIQEQVVWNTAHGRPFASGVEVAHYFGDHVSPLLGLFAPVYRLWEDPILLLILQTLALAACGPAAYRLSMRRTGRPWAGTAQGGLVLLVPALGFMNRYDIHAVTFVTPLLLWCIVCAEEGKIWLSRSLALLAIGAREEIGIVVALTAIVFWKRRLWGREALLWGAGAAAWSIVALFVILPHFRGGAASDTLGRYAHLGDTPARMLETLLTHPVSVLAFVFSREIRIIYLFQLLLPFAGRPLLRPLLLVPAVPTLVENLLSSNLSQASIYFQYVAAILPFLIWATADTLAPSPGRGSPGAHPGARRARAGRTMRALSGLAVATLAANVVDPALVARVGFPYAEVHRWERWVDREAFGRLAAQIPPEASLVTTDALAPHLSHRRLLRIYRNLVPTPPADDILLVIYNRRDSERPRETLRDIGDLLATGEYGVVDFAAGLVLLRRGAQDRPPARAALQRYAREEWGMEMGAAAQSPEVPSD